MQFLSGVDKRLPLAALAAAGPALLLLAVPEGFIPWDGYAPVVS